MTTHPVVAHDAWVEARKALLEKELTRARDALAAARRDLPWEKVDQDYVFDGPQGPASLEDLFAGRSQLIVYHFMFDPAWNAGCKSCSFLADHFNPATSTSPSAMSPWSPFQKRRSTSSRHSRNGWAGSLHGFRRSRKISTATTT